MSDDIKTSQFEDNDYINEDDVLNFLGAKYVFTYIMNEDDPEAAAVNTARWYKNVTKKGAQNSRDFHDKDRLKMELKRRVDQLIDSLYDGVYPFNFKD